MAYQLGVIQYRGKLGATVGRKKSAGQKANTIAARPQVVSNPRSNAQAAQRMKMAPAVNFYRALRGILNHSWQGVSYGGASHSRFMKEAMRSASYPYVMKGNTAPIPGAYKISAGSLAPVDVTLNNNAGSLVVTTSLRFSESLFEKSIKVISQKLVEDNPQLQMGDQLTFVAAVAEEIPGIEDGNISYRYFRFVLSDTDTSIPEEKIIPDGTDEEECIKINGGYISRDSDDNLCFAISNNGDMVAVGAAVIVSRPSVTKNVVTWERSNSNFKVTEPLSEYFSRNYDAVLASYQSRAASVSSDWFLNGGATGTIAETNLVTVTIQTTGWEDAPDDIVSGAGSYEVGSQVTVAVNTNQGGATFQGWKKDGVTVSTSTSYTFTVNSNVTLVAEFTRGGAVEEEP